MSRNGEPDADNPLLESTAGMSPYHPKFCRKLRDLSPADYVGTSALGTGSQFAEGRIFDGVPFGLLGLLKLAGQAFRYWVGRHIQR